MSLSRISPPSAPANDCARADAPRPLTPKDARVRRALEALESRPAERWTMKKLSKVAGLSRAALARRFVEELGLPPLRLLATLRMRRTTDLLVATDEPLAVITREVGYANEFALSRAFRRLLGEAPSRYRRRVRSADSMLATPRMAA